MNHLDMVVATCPECGSDVEFPSKAWDCDGDRYTVCRVPVPIAKDIEGDIVRCGCGLRLKAHIQYMNMNVVVVGV